MSLRRPRAWHDPPRKLSKQRHMISLARRGLPSRPSHEVLAWGQEPSIESVASHLRERGGRDDSGRVGRREPFNRFWKAPPPEEKFAGQQGSWLDGRRLSVSGSAILQEHRSAECEE